MSEFKGTPGPWKWIKDEDGHSFLSGKNAEKYHYVHSDGSSYGEYSPDIDVDGPDAKLIAAAPELLEALQWMKMALNSGTAMDIAIGQEKADAAIAKALGQ